MKLFISQPMNGKTDADILNERNLVIASATFRIQKRELNPPDIEVIDSFFQGAPHDAKPLWYLGESLKKLAEADVAIFAKGWQKSRGCRIEHEAAVAYGIEVMYE